MRGAGTERLESSEDREKPMKKQAGFRETSADDTV